MLKGDVDNLTLMIGDDDCTIISNKPITWNIHLIPDGGYVIHTTANINLYRRFMLRLLGFSVEKVNGNRR